MPYCYSNLGTNCLPQTCALTSNAKYISPTSCVYFKYFTNMEEYPAHNNLYMNTIPDISYPEIIKLYSGKNTTHGYNENIFSSSNSINNSVINSQNIKIYSKNKFSSQNQNFNNNLFSSCKSCSN